MNLTLNLIKEAFVVGILLVVLTHIIMNLLFLYKKSFYLSSKKNYNFELIVFMSGFLFHILCEITGLNIWYLKNSVAYKRTMS